VPGCGAVLVRLVVTLAQTGKRARPRPRCDPAARANPRSLDTSASLPFSRSWDCWTCLAAVSAGNAVKPAGQRRRRPAVRPRPGSARRAGPRPGRPGPRPRRHPLGEHGPDQRGHQRRVDRDRVDALDVHRALSHLRPGRLGGGRSGRYAHRRAPAHAPGPSGGCCYAGGQMFRPDRTADRNWHLSMASATLRR
jgi:hypothetical protein